LILKANLAFEFDLYQSGFPFIQPVQAWLKGPGALTGKHPLPPTVNEMSGSQWVMPMNVLFLRHKLMASLTMPVQSWEVSRTGLTDNVSFNGMHDPALRVGYQIWRDYAGFQAVSLHFEGRFASGNYHQPMLNMTDKTRTGV